MSFSNDAHKLLLFEVRAGKRFHLLTWIDLASPDKDVWYCNWTSGEVVEIKSDGTALTRKTSLVDCKATDGSYFHDFFASRVYVHLADGKSPAEYISPSYTHNVIAFVWKCYANRQAEGADAVVYIPEGCTYPSFYEPMLRPGTLAQLTASIADHFESAMQTTFGSVSISNDLGAWYALVDDWLWANKDARVRLGEIGDLYAAIEKIFVGKVKSPSVSDVDVVFDLVDTRAGCFQSIPIAHYNVTDWPNLNPDAVGVPVPILFGEKDNISPVCVDTVNRIYKVSQTHFGVDVFELSAIDAVYLKGVGLSIATHYTVDLHNGQFTLLFAPGDGAITCDAKGIKDAFNFTTGAATGLYSENVADHWFFVCNILNDISVADIDLTSFSELQAVRTQAVAWYLDQDTPALDFNRLLQQTSLYHFLPMANGTFAARYYRKTIPVGTLELRDYDHANYKKMRPDEGIFRDIFLKYAKDPTTGIFKQLVNTEETVEQDHETKEPFTVETALRDDTEAASVLAFYVSLLKNPPTKIETDISMIGKNLIPTDKLYNNRAVVADGHDVIISEDEVYVILEARKNIDSGRVGITAQLDTQLAIYTIHADSPHQDVPHEDHTDAVHTDAAHGNSHTDVPYSQHQDDAVHVDHISYTDHDDHTDKLVHEDFSYSDAHVDTPAYTDHDDVAYHDHAHVDTGHVDYTDTLHEDSHTDVSHIDSEV